MHILSVALVAVGSLCAVAGSGARAEESQALKQHCAKFGQVMADKAKAAIPFILPTPGALLLYATREDRWRAAGVSSCLARGETQLKERKARVDKLYDAAHGSTANAVTTKTAASTSHVRSRPPRPDKDLPPAGMTEQRAGNK